jgi:hypothetical protein
LPSASRARRATNHAERTRLDPVSYPLTVGLCGDVAAESERMDRTFSACAQRLTYGRSRYRTRGRSASSIGLGVVVFVDVNARTELGGVLDVSAIEGPTEQQLAAVVLEHYRDLNDAVRGKFTKQRSASSGG